MGPNIGIFLLGLFFTFVSKLQLHIYPELAIRKANLMFGNSWQLNINITTFGIAANMFLKVQLPPRSFFPIVLCPCDFSLANPPVALVPAYLFSARNVSPAVNGISVFELSISTIVSGRYLTEVIGNVQLGSALACTPSYSLSLRILLMSFIVFALCHVFFEMSLLSFFCGSWRY